MDSEYRQDMVYVHNKLDKIIELLTADKQPEKSELPKKLELKYRVIQYGDDEIAENRGMINQILDYLAKAEQ